MHFGCHMCDTTEFRVYSMDECPIYGHFVNYLLKCMYWCIVLYWCTCIDVLHTPQNMRCHYSNLICFVMFSNSVASFMNVVPCMNPQRTHFSNQCKPLYQTFIQCFWCIVLLLSKTHLYLAFQLGVHQSLMNFVGYMFLIHISQSFL